MTKPSLSGLALSLGSVLSESCRLNDSCRVSDSRRLLVGLLGDTGKGLSCPDARMASPAWTSSCNVSLGDGAGLLSSLPGGVLKSVRKELRSKPSRSCPSLRWRPSSVSKKLMTLFEGDPCGTLPTKPSSWQRERESGMSTAMLGPRLWERWRLDAWARRAGVRLHWWRRLCGDGAYDACTSLQPLTMG